MDGTRPTRMHSCLVSFSSAYILMKIAPVATSYLSATRRRKYLASNIMLERLKFTFKCSESNFVTRIAIVSNKSVKSPNLLGDTKHAISIEQNRQYELNVTSEATSHFFAQLNYPSFLLTSISPTQVEQSMIVDLSVARQRVTPVGARRCAHGYAEILCLYFTYFPINFVINCNW